MIQDIHPDKLSIEYFDKKPTNDDFIIVFKNNTILTTQINNQLTFPTFYDLKKFKAKYIYLFKINNKNFFLSIANCNIELPNFIFKNINILRTAIPKSYSFAAITAYHLNCWYKNNTYCGKCGHKLVHSKEERMLYCTECNNKIYPKIAPAIIVAISNGDKLLLTKYSGREYKDYALVAGFIEIGETPEETIKREVMEEVGLNVKNIRYYKSQPWGFSENLLLGYFAELDGNDYITMDNDELCEAKWVNRDDIKIEYNGISLTNELICKFKNNL